MPLEGQGGHVANDEVEVLFGNVAGKRDGVQTSAAYGGVAEQGVDGEEAFGPALGEAGVFEDGKHEAGVAGLLDGDGLDGGGDRGGGGEGTGRANRLRGEIFDGGADGDVFERRGREIDADIGPSGVAVDALGLVLNVEGGGGEGVGEFLAGGA